MNLIKNIVEPKFFCDSYKKEGDIYFNEEIMKGFDNMCAENSCFLSKQFKYKLETIKLKLITLKSYADVNSLKVENIINFFKQEPTDVLKCICKHFNIDVDQLIKNISTDCIVKFVNNLLNVYVKYKNKYINEQTLPEVELKKKQREDQMLISVFFDFIKCASEMKKHHESHISLNVFICIMILCIVYIIYFIILYYKKNEL